MPVDVVSTRPAIPAAATRRAAALLGGPTRRATVIHSGSDAAYLRVDGGRCVGLLASGARAVPCGLRTTLAEVDLPLGATAILGGGALRTDLGTVRVGRLVDAAVPRLVAAPRAAVRAVTDHPAVRAARAELPEDAVRRLAAGAAGAARALLGRGSGLTPLGDDVLCGYLGASHAAGRPATAVAAEVARLAPARTTTLSAALLDCAVEGEVLPEFAALVRSLHAPGQALTALVTVGHTSGAGLALGLALALGGSHDPGRTSA